jgi:rubrerythrin
MKLTNILETLGNEEVGPTAQTRRETLFNLGSMGAKIAMAAIPATFLSALPKISNAATMATVVDTLNFALKLEYLEDEFYKMGIASGVILSGDLVIFQQISKHESAHVAFLKSAILSLNGTAIAKPNFDFTAGGSFNPFSSYGDFLALSQAFEDTGVRAYKGQAGNLQSNDGILTAALQIHSVEARHASEVRRLRAKRGFDAGNKGWISGNSIGTMPTATQAVYNGEENITQGGVSVDTVTSSSAASIREAFDEPLTENEVLTIAGLFIK